jgi:hypothetical protein
LDRNENAFGFPQLMQKSDRHASSSWPGIEPFVMAGVVPAIHVLPVLKIVREDVDARHKAGHDEREAVRFNSSWRMTAERQRANSEPHPFG